MSTPGLNDSVLDVDIVMTELRKKNEAYVHLFQ